MENLSDFEIVFNLPELRPDFNNFNSEQSYDHEELLHNDIFLSAEIERNYSEYESSDKVLPPHSSLNMDHLSESDFHFLDTLKPDNMYNNQGSKLVVG